MKTCGYHGNDINMMLKTFFVILRKVCHRFILLKITNVKMLVYESAWQFLYRNCVNNMYPFYCFFFDKRSSIVQLISKYYLVMIIKSPEIYILSSYSIFCIYHRFLDQRMILSKKYSLFYNYIIQFPFHKKNGFGYGI